MSRLFFLIFLIALNHTQASIFYFAQIIQQESALPTGITFGTDLGYAWIQSPIKNDGDLDFIDYDKGHFAWGLFGGYQMSLLNILSAGCEIDYHDNGFSTYTFASGNRYRLQSKDWSFLLTIFYPVSQKAFIYVKGGGARVWQIEEIVKTVTHNEIYPRCKNKRWEPTITAGCSVSLFKCLYPFFHYRIVFGKDQTKLSTRRKFKDPATVNSFYGGIMANF